MFYYESSLFYSFSCSLAAFFQPLIKALSPAILYAAAITKDDFILKPVSQEMIKNSY
jgi:hypothetical protein